MNKLYAFIQGSWERLTLVLAILLFCLSLLWMWHRMTDMPHYREHFSDVPPMPHFYDWSVSAEHYFQPRLPVPLSPNPVQVVLKAKELPPPPPPPPPPPEVKEPDPPPPPPPKPVEKYIIRYRGSSVMKDEEVVILLEATLNDKTERALLHVGDSWLGKFTIIAHDENTITVQATNGKTEVIPWTKTAEFEY